MPGFVSARVFVRLAIHGWRMNLVQQTTPSFLNPDMQGDMLVAIGPVLVV